MFRFIFKSKLNENDYFSSTGSTFQELIVNCFTTVFSSYQIPKIGAEHTLFSTIIMELALCITKGLLDRPVMKFASNVVWCVGTIELDQKGSQSVLT